MDQIKIDKVNNSMCTVFACTLQMVTDQDIEGSTCLHLAVDNGHYEVAKMCLEKRRFWLCLQGIQ